MANTISSTDTSSWASAQFNYTVAEMAWNAVEHEENCPAREQVARTLAEARMSLFSVPAPDISGVIDKLSIWWGEELFDDSYESSQNRMVIGDLRRIAMQNAGLEEPEASGRSSEEAAGLADAWCSALADYNEEQRMLVEDHKDADINGLLHAEGVLLELPAPTLAGVVFKLELLWETDRFDSVEAGAFSHYVICDLNTLASRIAKAASDPR